MKRILLFVAIALSTLTFGQNVPNYVPTNGLVGWWPFNGNANDESGNGNNGTVNGATLTTDREGNANSAYSFDGVDDYIEVLNSASISPVKISISGWGYINNNETSNFPRLIHKGHNQAQNYGSYQIIGGNFALDSLGYSGFTVRTTASYNWTGHGGEQEILDQWFHFTGVYDGIQMKYYINGELVKIKNQTGTILYNTESLNFGGNYKDGLGYIKHSSCRIDDIGIWNRALTQQEIIDLYSGCNSINASINLTNPSTIGSNLTLSVLATGNNLNYQWETNPCKNGWQTVSSNSTYSGVSTSDLTVSNLELSNHQQPFRVIVSDNNCSDTSDVVYVEITDTCINTVTQSVAVTDTLIIDVSLAGLSAPNNINTMKVYPNPSNDIVNIDNGDYALMNGYSIKIINALGQEKFSNAINIPAFQIPMSQLGAVGVYYISIYDNQSQLVESKVLVLE